MREKSLRLVALIFGLGLIAPPASGLGQTAAGQPGFEREYLDPGAYRSGGVILHDWPGLTRLVRWSARIESAVTSEDATLSAELLGEFRMRVDSLAGEPLPGFLEGRADSARSALTAIDSILTRAEASLAALPPEAVPTGGEGVNAPERQRTLVTGRTAVTVPAGIPVGQADSLPTAELAPRGENFMDMVVLALTELDRLVHLTRTAGQHTREGPAGEAPSPPPGTGRRPPGR